MIAKLARPQIQTAVAGLVNAILVPLVLAGVLSTDMVAALLGIEAALAMLLSAWYSPNIEQIGPSGTDSPRWLE